MAPVHKDSLFWIAPKAGPPKARRPCFMRAGPAMGSALVPPERDAAVQQLAISTTVEARIQRCNPGV